MPRPRVVVIGASAGGIEAVTSVIGQLPADFPAAVFVVVHTGRGPSLLPSLFARATPLTVVVPGDRDPIRPSHLYVAPRDCHLLVESKRVRVQHGPRQHGFRPAIDPLFVSAARAHGRNAIGVVLSGGLDDGTAGLLAIKRAGGVAVVQNPEEATISSMPLSAAKNVEIDAILPSDEIGQYLDGLVNGMKARTRYDPEASREAASDGPSKTGKPVSGGGDVTVEPPPGEDQGASGALSVFRCPDCGGALWEAGEEGLGQYRCHIGHRFGAVALASLVEDRLEDTLWSAVRALKEHAALRRRMAERATKRSMAALAGDWLDEAKQSDLRADRIRAVIESAPGGDRAAERADATAADGRGTRSRKGRGGIKRRARQR